MTELQVLKLKNNSVTLEWSAPKDGSEVKDYVVHYQQVTNITMHETSLMLDQVLNLCQCITEFKPFQHPSIGFLSNCVLFRTVGRAVINQRSVVSIYLDKGHEDLAVFLYTVYVPAFNYNCKNIKPLNLCNKTIK